MRHWALLIFAWILVVAGSPASADGCDTLSAKIGAAVGASVEFRSSDDVHFDHPAYRMVLFCGARLTKIRIKIDDPSPPAEFFASLGLAGAVLTGAEALDIGKAAVACYKAGLVNPQHGAEILNRLFTLSCETRADGYLAFVYKEPRPERPAGSCISGPRNKCAPVDASEPCVTCGCRGGPGYRAHDGKCVSWAALERVCGRPPTTRCVAELEAVEAH